MDSPCTKVCKIDNGRCIGCQRSLDEIARWGSMTSAEQARVIDRINFPAPKEGQG